MHSRNVHFMLWFLSHKAKIPCFRARAVKAIQIVLKVSMFIYLTNILRIFMPIFAHVTAIVRGFKILVAV